MSSLRGWYFSHADVLGLAAAMLTGSERQRLRREVDRHRRRQIGGKLAARDEYTA